MIDRTVFQESRLPNGIWSYANPLPMDYSMVFVQIPRGTAHNTAAFLPGTFHFLEHACCTQSQAFPEANSYNQSVGLTGGWCNAATGPFTTTYQLSAPNNRITSLLDGLFSRAFEPLFTAEMLQNQRSVIANERLRSERWYPGGSEVSWYEQTQWQYDQIYPLRQIFGDQADLQAMDKEYLTTAHAHYLAKDIRVVAIGPADFTPLLKKLGTLSLQETPAPVQIEPMRWVRPEFHIKQFRDVSRYTLTIAGFSQPPLDLQTARRIRFILNYVTNTTHGSLHKWLRHDLGWSYGIKAGTSMNRLSSEWYLEIPVNNLEQIETVRSEWRSRVEDALADQASIDAEVERMLGASAYWNSDPEDMFQGVISDLHTHNRIVSDAERRQYIEGCRDSATLKDVYEQYFAEDAIGSYCAAPLVE